MLRVGLTGGIGCGKTTVAAMLRELGCKVIEADPIAHALTEPGQPAYDEIVDDFGHQILDAEGRIEREKLGAIVFEHPAKLFILNEIVHPQVIEEVERILGELETSRAAEIAVVEAALLAETGYHRKLNRLVVAWCRPDQQFERLLSRGFTREQAQQRIASQMPIEEKRALADDQIDCSGTIEETRRQVVEVVARLRQLAAK